jgi:hypothetical protein
LSCHIVRKDSTDVSKERLASSFFLGFLFDPEDGGDKFLRSVGGLIRNYRALEFR